MKRLLSILLLAALFASGGCQLMQGVSEGVSHTYQRTVADYQHVTNGTESPDIHGPTAYHP